MCGDSADGCTLVKSFLCVTNTCIFGVVLQVPWAKENVFQSLDSFFIRKKNIFCIHLSLHMSNSSSTKVYCTVGLLFAMVWLALLSSADAKKVLCLPCWHCSFGRKDWTVIIQRNPVQLGFHI